MIFNDDIDRILADFSCLDPTYVDGVFADGVVSLGVNIRVPLYRLDPERDRDTGVIGLRRTPALVLVGPRNMLLPIAATLETPPALDLDRLARH
jgi:hypothetical protein